MRLELYEVMAEAVTGFKAFKGKEQVGTIEKRDFKWIGAVFVGERVLTFQDENFEVIVNKVNKLSVEG